MNKYRKKMIIIVIMTRLSIKNNLVSLFKFENFKLFKISINKKLTLFRKPKKFFFDIKLKLNIFF